MAEKNIFVVGPEVKGESQMGYVRYLDQFTDVLLNTINNISITGLKRYGKTSIAKEVIDRVCKSGGTSVIAIYIDLAKQKTFSEFLTSIVNKLKTTIIEGEYEKILENRIYKEYLEEIKELNPEGKTYRDTVDALLGWITKKEYRIIIAIDEFDRASDIFEDTADFEYLRDLSSNRDIGVSLVLVSRRQLYMIEKRNFNNSTFHGVVKTYPIQGFDDADIKCFYKVLLDKYGIDLDEGSKERLKYYCGRSPYLLSMFAYSIVDDYQKNQDYNIDAIYNKCQIDVENYYKSIFACLNGDKIAVEGAYKEVSSIEKLIGIIIGPRIDVVDGDVDVLEEMGYLYEEDGQYLSISGHFTNALRRVPVTVDTWKLILEVEKKIKKLIRKKVMEAYKVEYIDYDVWVEVFEKAGLLGQLGIYDGFVKNSMQDYKKPVDILDVCSFDAAVTILQFYWENWFSGYFNNDDWLLWETRLRLCASGRDPMAHGHAELIDAEARAHINGYCEAILKLFSSNNACLDTETELKLEENIKKRDLRIAYYSNEYSKVNNTLYDQTVSFVAAEQDKDGIRGFFVFRGKYYKATIGKNKWAKKYPGEPMAGFVGKEYQVKVTDMNFQQDSLTIEFVK